MDITFKLREFKTANVTVQISIVDLCEQGSVFRDRWEASETHQAGLTVQVPDHLKERTSYKYYIGQSTPAEVASSYARQGRDNPSRTAYESLKEEMAYDLTAGDYTLACRVSVTGITLAETQSFLTFDHSALYSEETLRERATEILCEHGRDFVFEAIKIARNKLTTLAMVA